MLPNFPIHSNDLISTKFFELGITYFHEACDYIRLLPYGRNENKTNLEMVFSEQKGTCSTKHALLKQLALENYINDIRLVLGIFKMNANNTPIIADRLQENNLSYLPEAHTYLKFRDEYFDFTRNNSSPNDFVHDLLFEVEISPEEIGEQKIEIHRNYLNNWLSEKEIANLSLEQVWNIRENCIQDLSNGRLINILSS